MRFPSRRMIESYGKLVGLEIPQEIRRTLIQSKYGSFKTLLCADKFEEAIEDACIKGLKKQRALENILNYIEDLDKNRGINYLIGVYNGIFGFYDFNENNKLSIF